MTYESDTESADIALDARYEAMAERDDFDGYETARSEDRYLTGFGWDK